MNTPLKIKHLLILISIFLLGAGVIAGTGLFDNVVLNSYADFKTPTSTTTSLSGSSRVYYDSANQGLAVSNNAGTGVQLMNGRNKIINGNFNVWQRGTALTTVTTGSSAYLADRWTLAGSSTGSNDESQTTNISGVSGSYNAILIQPHTTNTAGIGSAIQFYQVIEGYNLIPLNNQTCTLSFWAKGTAGTYGISFHDGAATVSYVIDWVVPDTAMHKYVYTFTHSSATGTWTYTNGAGMFVIFALVAGSNLQQTAGSWQAGNKDGSANMTNTWTNSTSNTMTITQVQLEQGPAATQFEQLDYPTELVRCERYYEKSYSDSNTIGAASQGNYDDVQGSTQIGLCFAHIWYKVPKRATGSITLYSQSAGTVGSIDWYGIGLNLNVLATTIRDTSTNGFTINVTAANLVNGGAPANGQSISALAHWTVNSDF